MVVIELNGRLGNQLFQYAFARRLEALWKVPVFFSEDRQRFLLPEFFKLNWKTRWQQAYYKIATWRKKSPRRIIDLEDHDRCWEFLTSVETGAIGPGDYCLRGYFQSDAYFRPVESLVRREFALRRKQRSTETPETDIVLHVRKGDYTSIGSEDLGGTDLSLPKAYYERCLEKLGSTGRKVRVVTEVPIEEVQTFFSGHDGFEFQRDSLMEDFRTLTRARHLVIANSTFSWWAGYLGTAKTVFAPKGWLGFLVNRELPQGIETAKFQWVLATPGRSATEVHNGSPPLAPNQK